MMALSKIGPLLAVAPVTCAALATGAEADHRAVTIEPDNTAIPVSVSGLCDVTVAEQELPSDVDGTPGRNREDPIDGGIDVEVDVEVNANNATCGPAQGKGSFQGLYDLDTPIRIVVP